MSAKILLIDRDGTLIDEPEDYQVDRLEKIRFKDQVIPVLRNLQAAGYRLVMVSNQDGLGSSSFPRSDFECCQQFILQLFRSQGVEFSDIFICPHFAEEQCSCRKPATGLLDEFLSQNPMDLRLSKVIGDRQTDAQLAENLGIGYLPINAQSNWLDIQRSLLCRQAELSRQTRETTIRVRVNLDEYQPAEIKTALPFFNHMLEQIAQHSGIGLHIEAQGDIEVDDHHLIEDTALTLGQSLLQALGGRQGIQRYGFTLPMDDALASVALDLGGRSYCQFDHDFTREFVGGMATEMVPHFFRSLAAGLSATLHVTVKGENHHHMVEACFKAFGRCLKQAILVQGQTLPSTKGVL